MHLGEFEASDQTVEGKGSAGTVANTSFPKPPARLWGRSLFASRYFLSIVAAVNNSFRRVVRKVEAGLRVVVERFPRETMTKFYDGGTAVAKVIRLSAASVTTGSHNP
jgi:hypothetical protein